MLTPSPPPTGWGIRATLIVIFGVSSALIVGSTPVSAQSVECVHGRQQLDGACACDNCWTGGRCDQYADHRPFFLRRREDVTLNPYEEYDEPIFTADAVDVDEKGACSTEDKCPCGEIRYSFGTGNENALFNIDATNGQVTVSKDFLPISEYHSMPLEDSFELKIIAYNPESEHYDEMVLHVQLLHSEWDEKVPSRYLDQNGEGYVANPQHHVHKRATVTLPDNVTITLMKTGSSENTTEMRVGSKISFLLKILFPQTTTDMLVELFAPDNDTIVMMLCDVKVQSIGSNLAHTGAAQIVMDSQNSSTVYFDRAIIDFGNVTNGFTDQNDESASSIIITWDAVMIQNDNTVNDAVYWVSAGAEYNYEMEVFVAQASFTAKTDAEPGSFVSPTFNLTGPSTMAVGSSAVFSLDMYIAKPSTHLSVDAFAPLNNTDVMSICGMKVVDTGVNYECGFKPEEHIATFHADDNTRGYGRARLVLGTITNKGAREPNNPSANNRITVQFVVHVYDDAIYVGQSFWVGVAVEIGTEQIWAGEILVAITALPTSTSITPTWVVTKEGSGKVSTVSPLMMTLDLTVPQNTAGKYALEVLAPFSDSAAIFQLCAIRVVSFGDNLICTGTEITPIYSSRGSPLYVDRGYADLGTITNVGSWGWQPYNLTDAGATAPDVLRLQFLMKATNHSLATPGSQYGVTLGLVINDNRLVVGTYNVEVEAAADVPNITTETTPEWDLTWSAGEGNVHIGGAGQFLVNITTKRNTVYTPFDVEALMPNGTGATQVSVCKMQVHYVGTNLPCVVASALNASVAYTSLLNDGLYDRAVLNLPSVCNYELVNDTAEDVLTLKVGFMLQPSAGLVNGTEFWPSFGVMFSPYKMWVGQIKAWARDDLVNSNNAPHAAVIKSSGVVPVGYFASYLLLIKTVPGDLWPYTINVSVSTTGLSVCSVRVIEVGDNMPCTNGSAIEAVYEQDAEGFNVKGSLDLGIVSNVGSGAVAADNNADDNTIQVEVIISVTSDTAVIGDGSTHDFAVAVNYGTSAVNPTVETFTVVHDQSSINGTAANVTQVEFSVAPITETDNDTNVILGQSKRFRLCAWTYPGVVTKLSFKMLTPVSMSGVMEALYIGVSSNGKNVPCAGSCKAGVVTYEARAGSAFTDIATLDLGYLVNNNMDAVDADANKVCADGVFRVLKNDAVTPSDTLLASAAVNVNDVEITVVQVPLTVVDNSTFTDIYQDNTTLINGTIISVNSSLPDPLCLTPGDVQTFPLLLSVPPYVTSLVNMDIKLDVNESACMTIMDVRLVSVGNNLRGFGKDYDMQCTTNSSMGTTQMDTAECSFGVVTNPGMSHRCEDVASDDDSLYLEVDIQLADCPVAEKDAFVTASFGFKVASYIAILNYPVKVCRDGTELPVYNITAVANSTGDTMYINYNMRLDNTSKAEIHNSSLIVIPPPYVTCDTLQSSSGTNKAPEVDTASTNRMIIDVGSVYFTDALNLVVRCSAKSGYNVPSGISGSYTVVNHQMSGDVIPRAIHSPPLDTVWSDLDFVNFTATTVSDSGVPCTSSPVGLQSSTTIYDCQITDSQSSLTPVTNGRKGGTGWTPYVHDGELAQQRFFQVFFADKMLVDRVEVEQSGTAKAIEIKLAYSEDGKSFLDGDTITLNGLATEIVQVPNPKDSRVLRVYVTGQDVSGQRLKLAFEFYGCTTSSGGPTGQTAICAAANEATPTYITNPPDSSFYRRSFLALDSGTVFVCEGVVQNKGTVQRCFKSVDGTVWQPLDARVAAMVGHEPDTNRLYAWSHDGVTYMSSGDEGMTWASTNSDHVAAAKTQLLFKSAKDVPWTDNTLLPAGNPPTSYQQLAWGAAYDGLKKNEGTWNNKVKWDCC